MFSYMAILNLYTSFCQLKILYYQKAVNTNKTSQGWNLVHAVELFRMIEIYNNVIQNIFMFLIVKSKGMLMKYFLFIPHLFTFYSHVE